MVQAINDQDTVNRKTGRFCWTLWIMTILTTISWRMKQIFIFMTIILNTVATGRPRTLAIFTRNLYIPEKITVWCWVASFGVIAPYFFEDKACREVNSKFSPLHWDSSHISRTEVAETWCWKPEYLVSAWRGNGWHCNASPQRDVPSSRHLTKREYRMACKIALSRTPTTSYSGDSSRARCTKWNQERRWTWNRTPGTKWQQYVPPCCNE